MAELTVTIITPEAKQEDFKASSIVVPLEDGYWGILPNHSNMVAVLASGKVKIKTSKGEIIYDIPDGWIEIFHNRVIILTPSFELSD
jgi:F-type H+-transporting ATPase subunit epsilon